MMYCSEDFAMIFLEFQETLVWVGVGRLAYHGMKLDNPAVVRIIITR